ncbi:serine/arginine-rich splicing factor SR45a-like isoform X3 [Malus sylvestris]|uniref:serine/arginine-rich splicing factor SR45a-like isoform X3 n=1 Tax=Malus sylvestris TaxID=3752 RepID=UPI0021AC112A|nr:serine/arginine-rich splicing factor SR45a-like isoform X3 [Malus sylvestris]
MPYPRERRSASPHNAPSPVRGRRLRSLSRSRRSRSRSHESVNASNPGNNLYITGLSTRVTSTDLEKFFNKQGKVLDCHLVTDPRTRESRGFGFVTMETVEDAERCIKYLDRSVLEGRLVTVEKAKRKRGRTPTPGRYQGLRDKRDEMQDVIVIVIVTVDDLEAIHLVGCKTEILIPGTTEEDHALHMVGGRMNTRTHTGGAGNAPCQGAETLDRENPNAVLIVPWHLFVLHFGVGFWDLYFYSDQVFLQCCCTCVLYFYS